MERGHFDIIQVNFLLVGHTHTSIDQYFSVISKKLFNKCIGSPESLRYLFNECQSPAVNKIIDVIHDYREWLTPALIDVSHYTLPHVFLFKRVLGRAVCQHKPYTRSPRFLPVEPELPKTEEALKSLSRPLRIEPLSFLGGIETIQESLGIDKEVDTKLFSTSSDNDMFSRIVKLKELVRPLKQIEAKVSCEINNKSAIQSEVGYLTTLTDEMLAKRISSLANESVEPDDSDEVLAIVPETGEVHALDEVPLQLDGTDFPEPVTSDQLNAFSKILEQFNSEEKGYLIWLNYDKVGEDWLKSSPKVIDYSTNVS